MALGVRRPTTASAVSDTTLLVGALAVASLIELTILRTFTRTAIHIPAMNALQRPYEWLSTAGEYAYFVSVALLVPALAVLAFRLLGQEALARWPAMLGIAMFAVPGGLAAADAIGRVALDSATVGAVVVLSAAVASSRHNPRIALPAASFGVAYALSGLYTVASSPATGGVLPQSAWLLDGAELAGVVFALSSPFFLASRGDRVSRWVGIGVGGAALLMFVGSGSTSRFLLLWNVGLSGILPGVVYGVAAGALAFVIAGLLRSQDRLAAVGLLLLVSGGIGLHNTYQSGLIVAGLAAMALALGVPAAARPEPRA